MSSQCPPTKVDKHLHWVALQECLFPLWLVVLLSAIVAIWVFHIGLGHRQAQADLPQWQAAAKRLSVISAVPNPGKELDELIAGTLLIEPGSWDSYGYEDRWRYKEFFADQNVRKYLQQHTAIVDALPDIVKRWPEAISYQCQDGDCIIPGLSHVSFVCDALRYRVWMSAYAGDWPAVLQFVSLGLQLADVFRQHKLAVGYNHAFVCEKTMIRALVEALTISPVPPATQEQHYVAKLAHDRISVKPDLVAAQKSLELFFLHAMTQMATPVGGRRYYFHTLCCRKMWISNMAGFEHWPIVLDCYPLAYRTDRDKFFARQQQWLSAMEQVQQAPDFRVPLQHDWCYAYQEEERPVLDREFFLYEREIDPHNRRLLQGDYMLKQAWDIVRVLTLVRTSEVQLRSESIRQACTEQFGSQALRDRLDPHKRDVRILLEDDALVVLSVGFNGVQDYDGDRVYYDDDVMFALYHQSWLPLVREAN